MYSNPCIKNQSRQNTLCLTLIGMSFEINKNAHLLAPPRGNIYKTQWAWQGVKLTHDDVNFYLQKSLESFDKNSSDKIQSKK